MIQPLEKNNVLIREINAMMSVHRNPTRIREIEQEIASIERAGMYYQAKQLYGILSALKCDIRGVHDNFAKALRASGRMPEVMFNYARALDNLHCYTDALGLIRDVISQMPDNLEALEMCLRVHLSAFQFAGAREMMERLIRLDAAHYIPEYIEERMDMKAKLLELAGATAEQTCARVELAASVIHGLGIASPTLVEVPLDDGILYEFGLLEEIQGAINAEAAIHHAIAAMPYSPADRIVSFACVPDEYHAN